MEFHRSANRRYGDPYLIPFLGWGDVRARASVCPACNITIAVRSAEASERRGRNRLELRIGRGGASI